VDFGKPLTHRLTHPGKDAYGNSGLSLLIHHGIVDEKCRKIQYYQSFDASAALCNQQVGGSSPSTRNIVRMIISELGNNLTKRARHTKSFEGMTGFLFTYFSLDFFNPVCYSLSATIRCV
jgi:hypothetical protein